MLQDKQKKKQLGTFASYTFPVLPKQSIACFGVRLECKAENQIPQLLPYITKTELVASQRFVHMIDTVRHLTGRAVARRAISAAMGKKFCSDFSYTEYGKPFVPECDIHFSISHSGNMVWVALCRGATVGIDVEEERNISDILELAELLHPAEKKSLLHIVNDKLTKLFFRCWTRKEAVLKACGQGLLIPLDSFEVHMDNRTKNWVHSLPETQIDSYTLSSDIVGNEESPPSSSTASLSSYTIPTTKGYHCNVIAFRSDLQLKVFTI